MLRFVGQLRTCVVSFSDPLGNGRFSVEVTAQNRYEAVARALQLFKQEPWCSESACATGYVEVEVTAPSVKYKILLSEFDSWLQGAGGTPRDTALRETLKALLR